METTWDVWVNRCKWRCIRGNERDSNAEEELDSYIRKEFQKDEKGLPDHSMCLMECELEEVLNFPLNEKKMWFNSIEAARGRVPVIYNEEMEVEEDLRNADYEPQREGIRKWLATGWK